TGPVCPTSPKISLLLRGPAARATVGLLPGAGSGASRKTPLADAAHAVGGADRADRAVGSDRAGDAFTDQLAAGDFQSHAAAAIAAADADEGPGAVERRTGAAATPTAGVGTTRAFGSRRRWRRLRRNGPHCRRRRLRAGDRFVFLADRAADAARLRRCLWRKRYGKARRDRDRAYSPFEIDTVDHLRPSRDAVVQF